MRTGLLDQYHWFIYLLMLNTFLAQLSEIPDIAIEGASIEFLKLHFSFRSLWLDLRFRVKNFYFILLRGGFLLFGMVF